MQLDEMKIRQDGLNIRIIQTKKFKTNQLVLKFKSLLSEEKVTARALLPYVLQSSTEKWPTTALFRSHLDDLYGASASVDVNKKGEYHILTFAVDIANEKYLQDNTPLTEQALNVLNEMVFHPLLEDGAFSRKVVESEKRTLNQKLKAVKDDKMRYASQRLVEEMCSGEAYALHPNGIESELEKITPEKLMEAYQQMISSDEVDLYIVGDIDSGQMEELCKEKFSIASRDNVKAIQKNIAIEDSKKIIEKQQIKQGKLNIGYRSNTFYGDSDYLSMAVMNGILGGFPHSKLFMNVREKESLAYYAASRLESHKGLIVIMSGVEPAKIERAETIIEEQLEAIKNGDISDQELSQTKAVMTNQMLETLDSPRGIIEVLYQGETAGIPVKIQDWFDGIDRVTKEDVTEAAKKLLKDTTYILTAKEVAESA
ncbi:EF-P 5-aminopentanol modification-associated protein YfmF [Jeotgalibacillus terrae]|uniref:EF-P 5-aminopentanol modification-associated protein YfmF n=1 Tax=Jeotgalibacillus terrae TaxID=587735 RepID=A0ABW5ZMH0_9BACL|nr:pitrilysin family protein [Jeotgalibacillus terrae]MBM7579920.1 putative Zn-dependent peptidase [Jeotgalibacillus terrae]